MLADESPYGAGVGPPTGRSPAFRHGRRPVGVNHSQTGDIRQPDVRAPQPGAGKLQFCRPGEESTAIGPGGLTTPEPSLDGLVKLKGEANEAKERATQAYKPGFVSLSLYRNKNGDHLSSLLSGPKAAGFPLQAGRCCHRGRAANPGTGRAPTVPLFGLAPGGVWPSLRHRRRPDALTVRFHPYPPIAGRTVCFCATFRPPQ